MRLSALRFLGFVTLALLQYNALACDTESAIFSEVAKDITAKKLSIVGKDENRPWGGFFVIDEGQIKSFVDIYFSKANLDIAKTDKLSPKVLVIAPNKRLSWQYHHRRGELWSVVKGPVGVVRSNDDKETPLVTHETGAFIKIDTAERHRLVGLNDWAIVAEIWQHTDPKHPSDEADIVRVQDDFSRK